MGLIPGLGKSHGEGNSNSLQYSCLENSMDRGDWQAIVHGVKQSQTRLTEHTVTIVFYSQNDLNLILPSNLASEVYRWLQRIHFLLKDRSMVVKSLGSGATLCSHSQFCPLVALRLWVHELSSRKEDSITACLIRLSWLLIARST